MCVDERRRSRERKSLSFAERARDPRLILASSLSSVFRLPSSSPTPLSLSLTLPLRLLLTASASRRGLSPPSPRCREGGCHVLVMSHVARQACEDWSRAGEVLSLAACLCRRFWVCECGWVNESPHSCRTREYTAAFPFVDCFACRLSLSLPSSLLSECVSRSSSGG